MYDLNVIFKALGFLVVGLIFVSVGAWISEKIRKEANPDLTPTPRPVVVCSPEYLAYQTTRDNVTCTNYGFEGLVRIPMGQNVYSTECRKCGCLTLEKIKSWYPKNYEFGQDKDQNMYAKPYIPTYPPSGPYKGSVSGGDDPKNIPSGQ